MYFTGRGLGFRISDMHGTMHGKGVHESIFWGHVSHSAVETNENATSDIQCLLQTAVTTRCRVVSLLGALEKLE